MSTQVTEALHSPDKRIRIVSVAAAIPTVIGLQTVGKYLISMLSVFFGESFSYPQAMQYSQFASNLTWCALLIAILILLIRIAANGKAFTLFNVRILKIAGIILILSVILPTICDIVSTAVFARQEQFMSSILITLLQSVVQYANFYNITMILLIALCRECVYYGTMLQTESDETL